MLERFELRRGQSAAFSVRRTDSYLDSPLVALAIGCLVTFLSSAAAGSVGGGVFLVMMEIGAVGHERVGHD